MASVKGTNGVNSQQKRFLNIAFPEQMCKKRTLTVRAVLCQHPGAGAGAAEGRGEGFFTILSVRFMDGDKINLVERRQPLAAL